eukprot:1177427-Prorocentrum_minimum.AAC.2
MNSLLITGDTRQHAYISPKDPRVQLSPMYRRYPSRGRRMRRAGWGRKERSRARLSREEHSVSSRV